MTAASETLRVPEGGRIDRTRVLHFSFDGRRYTGFQGDSLASALLANGVHIVSRSFKSHRPRGITSAGPEEASAIVQVKVDGDTIPNLRATELRLYDGLEARSVNCWPSARFDLLALVSIGSRLFSAGFYYKTFMWPNWKIYRPIIRRMAGLGQLPKSRDANQYSQSYVHCDVLIVGAGAAGLSATLALIGSDRKVVLVEQERFVGGSLTWTSGRIDGKPASDWLRAAEQSIIDSSNVDVMLQTTAVGFYEDNLVSARQFVREPGSPMDSSSALSEKLYRIRAKSVVLTTGAIERPLVFPNNDRPGILPVSAVRRYLSEFSVRCGRRAVVFCNNDSAYRAALELQSGGIKIFAVIDTRPRRESVLTQTLEAAGIELIAQSVISRVIGRRRVSAVSVSPLGPEGDHVLDISQTITCDLVCHSGGWSPTAHLFSQAGGRLIYDDTTACFRPHESDEKVISAGAANGEFSLQAALREGFNAGLRLIAGGQAGPEMLTAEPDDEYLIDAFWRVPDNLKRIRKLPQYVDLLHDVKVSDIGIAARENFRSVEHFKRYTTTGMAIDQGKTSNVNALAILGLETQRRPVDVGTTKFRPPYTPVTLGALGSVRHKSSGTPLLKPVRRTPIHSWHESNGGCLEDYGLWQRVSFYRKASEETEQTAINREALHTRRAVSILDYCSLSKIEVFGSDATTFLNRVFANNMQTLREGFCRYGLVLNEQGAIVDDGVVARLAADHYIVTTTSGRSDDMAEWLDEVSQVLWPKLNVVTIPQTSNWATISLTGPKARRVLESMDVDIDLSAAKFPHMGVRTGHFGGIPTQILRVSFTGEMGFEINVPVEHGFWLWESLMEAGQSVGIEPLGLEALDVLRTEKGYLHVGLDTDSSTIPDDVGWGAPVAAKTGEFIGKRSLLRPEQRRPSREQFVGLQSQDTSPLPIGGQIVAEMEADTQPTMIGRVTSSCFSPTLGQPVALGVLRSGRERVGETVKIFDRGSYSAATVVEPSFYNPKGEKQRA